jgi:hypothetical protein
VAPPSSYDPLTIERFSYITLGVKDLDAAVEAYVELFQATRLEYGNDPDIDARYETLQMGDCLLEIAEPRDKDSALGRHVTAWGNNLRPPIPGPRRQLSGAMVEPEWCAHYTAP